MSRWDPLLDVWHTRRWVVLAALAALAAGLVAYLVLGADSEQRSGSSAFVEKTPVQAGQQGPSPPELAPPGQANPDTGPQPVGDDAGRQAKAAAPADGNESLSPDEQVALAEELSDETAAPAADDAEQPPNPNPDPHPDPIEPPPSHDHGDPNPAVLPDEGAAHVPGAGCEEGERPGRDC